MIMESQLLSVWMKIKKKVYMKSCFPNMFLAT